MDPTWPGPDLGPTWAQPWSRSVSISNAGSTLLGLGRWRARVKGERWGVREESGKHQTGGESLERRAGEQVLGGLGVLGCRVPPAGCLGREWWLGTLAGRWAVGERWFGSRKRTPEMSSCAVVRGSSLLSCFRLVWADNMLQAAPTLPPLIPAGWRGIRGAGGAR